MLTDIPYRVRNAARMLLRHKSVCRPLLESPPDDQVIKRVTELAIGPGLKVNLGCGTDYREGWQNIDGSNTLRVDRVLHVPREPLDDALGRGVASYILAFDVVEHVRHWEAVAMLGQMARTLSPGGGVEIRVPDCEYILASDLWMAEEKLVLMFGGQDAPQGRNSDMDRSRAEHPEFFCHAYGWTIRRMRDDLLRAGFAQCAFRRSRSNFIAYAVTPE